MTWVLLIGAAWLSLAVLVGVLVGRGIRLADRKQEELEAAEAANPNYVVDLTPPVTAEPAIAGAAGTPVADTAAAQPPAAAEAPPEAAPTPERTRHPIPAARPPAAQKPAHLSERSISTRHSGMI